MDCGTGKPGWWARVTELRGAKGAVLGCVLWVSMGVVGLCRAIGRRRVVQGDAAQGAQQHIGHRGKPQAQLVCPHGGGRGAIGIKIELTLLDPVLHVAAGAVDLFVKIAGLHSARVSEVTTKRGLASSFVYSAFATTRRWRLQLLRVIEH